MGEFAMLMRRLRTLQWGRALRSAEIVCSPSSGSAGGWNRACERVVLAAKLCGWLDVEMAPYC